jgi:hypothetical protein
MNVKTEQPTPQTSTLAAGSQVVNVDPADVLAVVKKLGSGKNEEREAAEKSIARMGPAAVEVLVGVVTQESAGYRKKQRCTRYGMVAFVAAVVLPLLFIVSRGLITGVWKGMGDYFTFLPSMVGAMGAVAAVSQLHKNAATALASVADVRAVGTLIEVLEVDDKAVQGAAVRALTGLLPQLDASHAGLVTDEHRRILNRAIAKRKDEAFVIAVLQAYHYIGTGAEVESVSTLASGKGPAASSVAVRDAAAACLPHLQERAVLEEKARTLVRASANPDEPAQGLLRPAANGTAQPEQLLRPSTAE